jgi:hypothetical protein
LVLVGDGQQARPPSGASRARFFNAGNVTRCDLEPHGEPGTRPHVAVQQKARHGG